MTDKQEVVIDPKDDWEGCCEDGEPFFVEGGEPFHENEE